MIEIDGSYGEGGGQIARTAMALSVLTGKEFRISDIRSGRKQSGLKAQHLMAITALKEICDAKTNDIEIGSTELEFKPRKIKKGTFEIDIKTAGSITLLLQALLLPCMFAPSKITLNIKGGTSGKWQASVDYLQNILLPHLKRFVKKIEIKILKRGYYPKGGGEVSVEISPKLKIKDYFAEINNESAKLSKMTLNSNKSNFSKSSKDFDNISEFVKKLNEETIKIDLTKQGKLEQIKGIVNCSRFLEKGEVAERIKISAEKELKKFDCPINIDIEYADSLSPGGEIILWGKFSKDGDIDMNNPIILGSDARAERGKSSEDVGKEAALELISEINSGGCVDKHLGDQLLVFMSLLPGSKIKVSEITNHSKTVMWLIEKFLDVKFKVYGNEISVEGKNV